MQPNPRAVLFDLDGTLVDSLGDFHHAANQMLMQLGYPSIAKQYIKQFVGNGQEVFIARCLVNVGAKMSADELSAATTYFEAAYDQISGQKSMAYPGVIDFLSALKQKGIATGLCTNRPVTRARRILVDMGMGDYFDVIAGFESTAKPKPDPAPLNYCLSELAIDADDAVFVGDSEVDALAAHAAGVEFWFHTNGLGTLCDQPCAKEFGHYSELLAEQAA